MNRRGYCIFINTCFHEPVPSVKEDWPDDDANDLERICVLSTELEAQHEVVDPMMIRLQEFLDGERDFQDAITVEEYIVEVDVGPDGTIIDADGNNFA